MIFILSETTLQPQSQINEIPRKIQFPFRFPHMQRATSVPDNIFSSDRHGSVARVTCAAAIGILRAALERINRP